MAEAEDMSNFLLDPYVALVLLGFLPSEVWRWLGIVLGRGLDETSEIIQWVRAVATSLVAGVVARIVLFPPGALASVPVSVRLVALACGFFAYLFIRRSPFAGILVGETVLVAGAVVFDAIKLP
jgi:Branched-chain amino acid transport protein (AzlD)